MPPLLKENTTITNNYLLCTL